MNLARKSVSQNVADGTTIECLSFPDVWQVKILNDKKEKKRINEKGNCYAICLICSFVQFRVKYVQIDFFQKFDLKTTLFKLMLLLSDMALKKNITN